MEITHDGRYCVIAAIQDQDGGLWGTAGVVLDVVLAVQLEFLLQLLF